mmetsp:Transcript_109189/g.340282  ORF Transcript_109189/g.340282 Transcript_109189/m.340282 type:complete len:261 (+) Transcript_109189:764-1546(+)
MASCSSSSETMGIVSRSTVSPTTPRATSGALPASKELAELAPPAVCTPTQAKDTASQAIVRSARRLGREQRTTGLHESWPPRGFHHPRTRLRHKPAKATAMSASSDAVTGTPGTTQPAATSPSQHALASQKRARVCEPAPGSARANMAAGHSAPKTRAETSRRYVFHAVSSRSSSPMPTASSVAASSAQSRALRRPWAGCRRARKSGSFTKVTTSRQVSSSSCSRRSRSMAKPIASLLITSLTYMASEFRRASSRMQGRR